MSRFQLELVVRFDAPSLESATELVARTLERLTPNMELGAISKLEITRVGGDDESTRLTTIHEEEGEP